MEANVAVVEVKLRLRSGVKSNFIRTLHTRTRRLPGTDHRVKKTRETCSRYEKIIVRHGLNSFKAITTTARLSSTIKEHVRLEVAVSGRRELKSVGKLTSRDIWGIKKVQAFDLWAGGPARPRCESNEKNPIPFVRKFSGCDTISGGKKLSDTH